MTVFAFLNVDTPWIAWLVYRGEMVSPRATGERILSIWHAKYLIDGARQKKRQHFFKRELEIEDVRREAFPDAVSRLSGLYFFEDVETAENAGFRWDRSFRHEFLAEIELVGAPRISKYDSEWISHNMDSSDNSWIRDYLAGKPYSDTPSFELLVEGRGFVLGTTLRQRAYETIKRTWPESLALLELSRVAVELGSDLGMIAPIVTQDGNAAELQLYLNFRDATNQAFLDRFSAFNGPKNTADLNATSDLVPPNLLDYSVKFTIPGSSRSRIGRGLATLWRLIRTGTLS